jgi:hypothetical protein
MVRVTDDAHQKRRHCVVVDDAVETLAADLDLASLNLSYAMMEGRFSYNRCTHSIASDLDPSPSDKLPGLNLVFR